MLRLVAHHCLAKHSAFGNFRRTLRRLRKLVRDFQKLQKPIHQTRKDKQTERSGLSIIEKNYRESFWFIGQRVVGSCQRCVRVLWQKREQTVCFRTARVVRKQDLSLTQCARAELAANGDHSANRQREQAALHAFATFRGERRSVGASDGRVLPALLVASVHDAKCTVQSARCIVCGRGYMALRLAMRASSPCICSVRTGRGITTGLPAHSPVVRSLRVASCWHSGSFRRLLS